MEGESQRHKQGDAEVQMQMQQLPDLERREGEERRMRA